MTQSRCLAGCNCNPGRRDFIKKSAIITAGTLMAGNFGLYARKNSGALPVIKPAGETSHYVPIIRAAFVRRKEEYGMRWPGAVYDGEAARTKYTDGLNKFAGSSGINLDLREIPIYSPDEADNWINQAKETKADGLFLVLLDRQDHAWPTAAKCSDSGIPVII